MARDAAQGTIRKREARGMPRRKTTGNGLASCCLSGGTLAADVPAGALLVDDFGLAGEHDAPADDEVAAGGQPNSSAPKMRSTAQLRPSAQWTRMGYSRRMPPGTILLATSTATSTRSGSEGMPILPARDLVISGAPSRSRACRA